MNRNKLNTILYFLWTKKILFVLALLCPTLFYGQSEKKHLKDGNESYNKSDYSNAEKEYSKALNKNKDSYKGSFNLGDAYYKQGKYEEAANQFQLLTHSATSKDTLAKAFHNLGNSLLKSKKYQESVDAYKNALKNNPDDLDTRYNLAYAQQFLKQQQQKKDKKDEKKKEDKKEKKDDKKNEKKDDKKDKEKQDKEKEEQQKNKISKEDAQRLLDALQNDEKNLQNKMKKEKVKGSKKEIEKDW